MTARAPRVRDAVFWSYVLSGGRSTIVLAVTFVLAALLGPAAFGLLAMALVVMSFVELLLNQGLLPALVQRPVLEDRHIDTAFWLIFPAGMLLSVLTLITAPVWAAISNTPELTNLVRALSLLVPVQAAAVVPDALLRRALQFRQLAVRSLLAAAAGGIAGIATALAGWGVWALVIQQMVRAVVAVVVLYAACEYRPRRRFESTAARELYGFSLRSSLGSFGVFAGSKADVIVAGLFFGPVAVGIYRLGLRLTDVALEITSRSMQAVSLPAMARVQRQPEVVKSLVLRMFHLTSCLSLPALGFLLGGSTLVTGTLGGQWSDASVAVQGLAAAQVSLALSLLCGPVLQALGRPGLMAMLSWSRSVMWVTGLLFVGHLVSGGSTQEQVGGMAIAAFVIGWASAIMAIVAVQHVAGLKTLQILKAWRSGTAGLICAAISASLVTFLWPDGGWAWLGLCLGAAASLGTSGAAVLLLDPELRRQAGLILQRLSRRERLPVHVRRSEVV